MYTSQNDLTPQYITIMFTPSNSIFGYNTRLFIWEWPVLFPPDSTYGSSCFAQTGCRLWNNIPDDVQITKGVAISLKLILETIFSMLSSMGFIQN